MAHMINFVESLVQIHLFVNFFKPSHKANAQIFLSLIFLECTLH